MNFDTSSFEEFKQVNNLTTEDALTILLEELEKLKKGWDKDVYKERRS